MVEEQQHLTHLKIMRWLLLLASLSHMAHNAKDTKKKKRKKKIVSTSSHRFLYWVSTEFKSDFFFPIENDEIERQRLVTGTLIRDSPESYLVLPSFGIFFLIFFWGGGHPHEEFIHWCVPQSNREATVAYLRMLMSPAKSYQRFVAHPS